MEPDGPRLQRPFLWITVDQPDLGCLRCPGCGSFTAKCYREGNQHGRSEQIGGSKRDNRACSCRNCDADERFRCNWGNSTVKCVCYWDRKHSG